MTSANVRIALSLLLLTAISVTAVFIWQSHKGFSLLDEGYLWYGAQRVLEGEVPMRDYMAYDIGRYYWSAAFMWLLGDNGIVALRVATAAFQALALFTGLLLLARGCIKQHLLFWIMAAITLLVWMAPQYRLFDISMPVILTGTLAWLIEQPNRRRYFMTGMIIGLAAVCGRNHGLYGVAGTLGVMLYLATKREGGPGFTASASYWLLGIAVGYLPVLVFLAFVPGFAQAFWDSIRLLFEIKATNYPLPVPWPWRVSFDEVSFIEGISGVLEGIFFIAIIVFVLLGLIWVIRNKLQSKPVPPMLVASAFLALPYAHYAYSRADLDHLAPGIPPFLIGIFALLASQSAKIKWPFATLLCGASLLVMLPMHPGWYCYTSDQCVDFNVAADKLVIDPDTAGNLGALNKFSELFAPGDQSFIAAPFWPGAYAALGRKSPMWEIYALFPRNPAFEQAEIERIKAARPGFVVINDFPLDGREELRFHNSHPMINQYIRDHFDRLEGYTQNPYMNIYRSRH